MRQLVYANRNIQLLLAVLALAALSTMPANAQEVGTMQPLTVTITESGLVTSMDEATGGLYLLTIRNESSTPRGIVMRGGDLIDSPYIRYSHVLQPGQSETFRWYFPSERTVMLRDIFSCTRAQRTCISAGFGQLTETVGFE